MTVCPAPACVDLGLPTPWSLHRRRRIAVPTQSGWPGPATDRGPGGPGDAGLDDGGLAGVSEPRRPLPSPPGMSAALPLPLEEPVS